MPTLTYHKESPPPKRAKPNRDIYGSYRWQKASALFLKRNPLCIQCKKEGIIHPSEVTDHIVPISEGGEIWNPTNWQPLCKSHHNSKSASERNRKQRFEWKVNTNSGYITCMNPIACTNLKAWLMLLPQFVVRLIDNLNYIYISTL